MAMRNSDGRSRKPIRFREDCEYVVESMIQVFSELLSQLRVSGDFRFRDLVGSRALERLLRGIVASQKVVGR